jgi:beta-glucosidase
MSSNNQSEFKLPDNFIIGTASSAHQVEGDNRNSDWWYFETESGTIENGDISGLASNHYQLYDQDFNILSNLGINAQRLSTEWSRIFPKPYEIDQDAVNHYRDVLNSLIKHNQKSFVTLHHFTVPQWFIEIGGFTKEENLSHWRRFVELITTELGCLIDVFNTINEPYVYVGLSYYSGIHSPGIKSMKLAKLVADSITRAHFIAVEIIRKNCPNKLVGIVKNLLDAQPLRWWSITGRFLSWKLKHYFQEIFFKTFPKKITPFGKQEIKKGDIGDFIGINFYVTAYTGITQKDFMINYHPKKDKRITQMEWGVTPSALTRTIKRMKEFIHLPIYITENGIATDDDRWRQEYIYLHLREIHKMIETGVDIRGYFYWSFIDNFEWANGFEPKFGIIEVNYKTFERKIRQSGYYLGNIAMNKLVKMPINHD